MAAKKQSTAKDAICIERWHRDTASKLRVSVDLVENKHVIPSLLYL